jgi:hypothetical protein
MASLSNTESEMDSEVEPETPEVGGRPKMDDVWHHVKRNLMGDSKWRQVCKYCGKCRESVQQQSTDWALHLVSKCKKVPVQVSRAIALKSTSKLVKRKADDAGVTGVDIDLTVTAPPSNNNGIQFANRNTEIPSLTSFQPKLTAASTTKGCPSYAAGLSRAVAIKSGSNTL